MKKSLKPLTLHCETLRVLDLHGLPVAITGQSGASCVPTCGNPPGVRAAGAPHTAACCV